MNEKLKNKTVDWGDIKPIPYEPDERDDKITKLEQALAVAEEALEDIGHDQVMIGVTDDLAVYFNNEANKALEKIKAINA